MAEITATVRPTREEVVPSRKRVKLPAWLEVAKPRLIPVSYTHLRAHET